MSQAPAIIELEESIARFYERFSARKVALASFLVGVFSIGIAFVIYSLTHMALFAIIAFALVGILAINLCMIFVVPPAKKLAASRELICSAIREPSKIKAFDIKGVKLADKEGKVITLAGTELMIWRTMVVPYFVQRQAAAGGATSEAKTGARKMTASERKYIEDRRREVLEIEKKIDEERAAIEKDRKELESRSEKVSAAEKMASEKLAQAESVNLEAIEAANAEREAAFKKREAEIEERARAVEKEAKDLEERSEYVSNVEDSLVERLNELTTREASIEQGEVNAGLRKD